MKENKTMKTRTTVSFRLDQIDITNMFSDLYPGDLNFMVSYDFLSLRK